jgi:hypothetical protein
MMSPACPLLWVSDACSPCMFPGRDTRIPPQTVRAMHWSSMTHGSDPMSSCPFLPSRLGEGAFSDKHSLIHFPPRQGGEALGTEPWCGTSPCREVAPRLLLRWSGPSGQHWDPLAQSADSSPRSCPATLLLGCRGAAKRSSDAWA